MNLSVVSGIVMLCGLLLLMFGSLNSWVLLSIPSSSVIPSSLIGETKALPSDVRFRDQAIDVSVASEIVGSKSSNDSDCDLYHGEWYYDDNATPLYTSHTCPIMDLKQNCEANGRPDKDYEKWRWKPTHCELPRFNATDFLELMKGSTLAIVGDSLGRNLMESLVCSLWQVEVPERKENGTVKHWYFRSKSVTVIRIWSPWLVHHTTEPFSYVPEGVSKIHLDVPDVNLIQSLWSSDVVVFCNGHWFPTQSVYIKGNKIVGAQLWALPAEHQAANVSNSEAFRISTETALAAVVTHPTYSGLTIVVSYSPDHVSSRSSKTRGSCIGKTKPLLPGQLVENKFTNTMHDKQLISVNEAVKKQTNKSKLKLMDITEAFGYRHDAHPGNYTSIDPQTNMRRRPDCMHWCVPGAIDTWTEMMLEIIRRV